MEKSKSVSGISIFLSIVLMISGILIIIISPLTMQIIGSLLALGSVIYLIIAINKGKKKIEDNNHNDLNKNDEYYKFREESDIEINQVELPDDEENIESINEITVAEVPKTNDKKEFKPIEQKDFDDSEHSGIRIIAKDKELKYSYGAAGMTSVETKTSTNEIVTSVRDVHCDELTEIDLESDILFNEKEKLFGTEPRKEFDYLISKILLLIRSLTKTRTVVFALVDNKRKSFIIESFVTNKADAINPQTEYSISNDIISQVISSNQTIVLSEINPSVELDLIPYYSKHLGTLSVIALPIFRWDGLVGVLCLDSSHAGAYTSNTPKLIEQFTGILSAVISNYIHKFELVQSAKTLEAISLLQYKSIKNNNDIFKSFSETISETFDYDVVGICSYNQDTNNWSISNSFYKEGYDFYAQNLQIDLKLSLLGNSIIKHQKIYYELKDNDKSKILVKQGEPKFTNGSIAIIPISYEYNVFGAMFIINSKKNEYSDFEKGVINTLTHQVGLTIDKLRLINILHNSAIIDPNVGVYNTNAFQYRLNHETARAKDFKSNLILCVFTIDKYATVNWGDPEISDMTYDNIIQIIRRKLKPYDVFGNCNDDDTYAILLIEQNKSNAKIWAESLRKEIANSILNYNNNKFSVTISLGLTDYRPELNAREFLNNAYSAWKEAAEKGNNVCSY